MAILDLQSRKCTRTIEALKFRFGGSAQFGVKAVGLSSDGAVVCACVKQTKMRVSVWNASSGEVIAAVDVDNDHLSKCLVLGNATRTSVLLSTGTSHASSSSKLARYVLPSKSGYLKCVWQQMFFHSPYRADHHSC